PFAELVQRGLDVESLERAGPWAFSRSWLERLRADVNASLAARQDDPDPGLPATALVGEAPWAADVLPLLELERAGARLYLPGSRPSPPTETAVRLGDGARVTREEYDRAKAVLVDECERAGTITLAR